MNRRLVEAHRIVQDRKRAMGLTEESRGSDIPINEGVASVFSGTDLVLEDVQVYSYGAARAILELINCGEMPPVVYEGDTMEDVVLAALKMAYGEGLLIGVEYGRMLSS